MKSIIKKISEKIAEKKPRSSWERGVRKYAEDFLDDIKEFISCGDIKPRDINPKTIEKIVLNGAPSWHDFSWGGCSFIYDGDIARRLCTPSELRKTENGTRRPNTKEEWLDVQARALFQAAQMIRNAVAEIQAQGAEK